MNVGRPGSADDLMLSGIGPADTLSTHDIAPVYINEAVGQNLIDRKEVVLLIPTAKEMDGEDIGMLDFAAMSDDYWSTITHKFAIGWGNVLGGCGVCELIDRTQEYSSNNNI